MSRPGRRRTRPRDAAKDSKVTAEPAEHRQRSVWPGVAFGALVVVCLGIGAWYLRYAGSRADDQERSARKVVVTASSRLAAYLREPHLVFRSTALGDTYGKVSVVPLSDPGGPRAVTNLECERVDMVRHRGLCLVANRGVLTTYGGLVFDGHFRVKHRFDLAGLPSRARVAPDGRLAAMTVFVSGDSYAADSFSTRTTFLDLDTGKAMGTLEDFDVKNNGEVVDAVDRNYWGVTFTPDSDSFYATLSTGGKIYLIKGSVSQRSARVVDEGVECPSLSPDANRIAYKKRLGGIEAHWRLHVLDLGTGDDRTLAETRNVDDQVEWLDDHTVMFGLPQANSGTAETNSWTVPADGSGKPRMLVPRAWSAAAVPT